MSFGRLFTTSDGGRSWDSAALPGASEQVYPGAPTVFGRTVIVVAGGITDGIYVSRNGGNDWTLRQVPPHSYGGLAFSLASATTWLVGAGKRMWLTSDAGRSWRFVPMHDVAKSPNANLFQLDFSSRHSGWALFGNTLYRTVDGGVHWRRAEPHWVVVKQVGGVVKRVRS